MTNKNNETLNKNKHMATKMNLQRAMNLLHGAEKAAAKLRAIVIELSKPIATVHHCATFAEFATLECERSISYVNAESFVPSLYIVTGRVEVRAGKDGVQFGFVNAVSKDGVAYPPKSSRCFRADRMAQEETV